MLDKQTERKNKIIALILVVLTIMSVTGAIIWFNIYAPQVLQ